MGAQKIIPPNYSSADPLGLKVITPRSANTLYPQNLINYAVTESTKKINTLEPETKKLAIMMYKRAFAIGLLPLVFSGYRSIEKQRELWQLYNEDPTKYEVAAEPGSSYHNYGRAFDIMILKQGGEGAFTPGSIALQKINLEDDLGLKWGGNFKDNKDPFHFANTSISIGDLKTQSDIYADWLDQTDEKTRSEIQMKDQILKDYHDYHKKEIRSWTQRNMWIIPVIGGLAIGLLILAVSRFRSE